jgi:hypothetical protein
LEKLAVYVLVERYEMVSNEVEGFNIGEFDTYRGHKTEPVVGKRDGGYYEPEISYAICDSGRRLENIAEDLVLRRFDDGVD